MIRVSASHAVVAAMLGLLGCLGPFGTANAQDTPNIVAGSNGEAEATFSSNNCVVYYNASGARRSQLPSCRSDQVAAADRGVAAYRREQGLSAPMGDAPPIVNVGETGFGSVSYQDGCVVNYRQDGSRQNTTGRCGSDQVRRADDAMANYRREQGLGHGGHHGGMAPPQVSMSSSTGYGNVRFDDGCIVTYRRDGGRSSVGSRCSDDQARHADDAMARYRREQGMGSGDAYGSASEPRVSQLHNGTVQMLYMEPFCTIYFNDKGLRTSATKDCTKDQLVDSGLRIIRFRREHGLQ